MLRANALGDLVVALPALDALRAAYPESEITLLGREHHVAILGSRPSPVDRVVALPAGIVGDEPVVEPGFDRAEFIGDLAARRFDLAIQLHGGGRHSNELIRALGAETTAGSRASDAPELDRWISYQPFQWEVARYLDVVSLVGAEPAGVEPRLAVTDDDWRALAAEMPDLDRSGRWVVIHPGATDPRRRWPAESFAAVAEQLAATGRAIVVTGVPAERRLVEAVVDGVGHAAVGQSAVGQSAVGQSAAGGSAAGQSAIGATRLSLQALLALLAGADLVVSNDTGPLHLATAVGTPTVGIFWVGNLINAGPFSRLRDRPLTSWQMTCPVCGADASERRCEHDPSYVAGIPVEAVLREAASLLEGTGRPR